jgi:hypothetical protein
VTRGKGSGRIRSIADAERLLGDDLPNQILGAPASVPVSEVRALPVDDPDAPDVVADFAARIVLTREGRNLRERRPGDRARRGAAVNLWWIAYGPIVRASDGGLVIGALTLAPRDGTGEVGADVALGVTGEVLRALAPAKILAEAVAYLRRTAAWLDSAEQLRGRPAPEPQKRALARVAAARTRPARVPDDELAWLAARYVVLFRRGVRRPIPQLAAEFGLTREQVRDRVHRAREREFLSPGRRGRAGGEPGPRLLARWSPPEPPDSDEPDRRGGKSRRRPKGERDA